MAKVGAVIALRPRVIYRTRVPVEIAGQRGFADTWTPDRSRADVRAEAVPEAFVEALTWAQIQTFEPAAQLKARAAWANAFPDE